MAFAREPNGARRAVALICILSGSPLHTGQTRFSGEQFSKCWWNTWSHGSALACFVSIKAEDALERVGVLSAVAGAGSIGGAGAVALLAAIRAFERSGVISAVGDDGGGTHWGRRRRSGDGHRLAQAVLSTAHQPQATFLLHFHQKLCQIACETSLKRISSIGHQVGCVGRPGKGRSRVDETRSQPISKSSRILPPPLCHKGLPRIFFFA